MPMMDKRIILLIGLLAKEQRSKTADVLDKLKDLEAEFSPEELAGMTSDDGVQDLPSAKRGLEKALAIVDAGVEALVELDEKGTD